MEYRLSRELYIEDYFDKIDTKEKAYIVGFILGDSCITENSVTLSIQLADKCILDLMQKNIGCRVVVKNERDMKKKIFPSANIKIGNRKIVRKINMLSGGTKKQDRHIPIIPKQLDRYMLQGFFDADGCITWGYRKDRHRIWQKISFTSQLKMLSGIQNILIRYGIPTKIYPKADNDCFVMELSNKENVLKTLNLIYSDENFVVLDRKYKKALALRLELGENGEGHSDE